MRLLVIGLSLIALAVYIGVMLWNTQRLAAQILFGSAAVIALLLIGGFFGVLGGA